MKRFFTQQYRLILVCALLITVGYNPVFFGKLTDAFPLDKGYGPFVVAVGFLLFLATALLMTLLASRKTTKPVLILFVVSAAAAGYFMRTYGVVIDSTMWQNITQTDKNEAAGLMNLSFALQFGLLGVLPAVLIARWKLAFGTFRQEAIAKTVTTVSILVLAGITLFAFSANFASFFREYKPIRYYANPAYAFYSGIKFATSRSKDAARNGPIAKVSTDAKFSEYEQFEDEFELPDRELVVLVIGESARGDHFQLNGYARETNPKLSAMNDVASFRNFTSCGTTTAVSVPCMFTLSDRKDYDDDDIYTHENVLDVLKRNGVNVLWRDNNSSSKGVADRVEYQDFRTPEKNPSCKENCLDEGLIPGLQDYIDAHPKGDILIILHQLGSHGPEYYKRYPADAEFFKPVCQTSKLGDCTEEEITNAYDNTIRYTDQFLSEVIGLLKQNDTRFEASMVYISDHGESLGENGVYLHGMPFAIAPDAQKHVGMIVWGGSHFDYSIDALKEQRDTPYTQDYVYCMLLTLFEVETQSCPADRRIFHTLTDKEQDEKEQFEKSRRLKPKAGAESPVTPEAVHPAT